MSNRIELLPESGAPITFVRPPHNVPQGRDPGASNRTLAQETGGLSPKRYISRPRVVPRYDGVLPSRDPES